MCLAIPGQILDAQESGGGRMGRIQFGGIVRSVRLDFVPKPKSMTTSWCVGFAISRVDGEEAKRTYRILKEMGARCQRNCRRKIGPYSQGGPPIGVVSASFSLLGIL
jgi:hydrogenase expression/formation protein HypC